MNELFLTLALTLHSADMLQTLDIKNHRNVSESNYILGKNPSDKSVITYFTATAIGYYISRKYLNNQSRLFFDIAFLFNGVASVANNRTIGLRFNF